MSNTQKIQKITIIFLMCIVTAVSARINPELNDQANKTTDYPLLLEESVVCSVGAVHNTISNTTRLGNMWNVWTVVIGDLNNNEPSMIWTEPEEYAANNHYLYYGSLRVGYDGRLVRFSEITSPGLDVTEPPNSESDFDTHFFLTDDHELNPEENIVGVRIHQNTYAWDESDADDFIIYDYWIVNFSDSLLDSVYVALHADCDISSAAGGSGPQGWYFDDLVSYYRDDETGEYISYMYDADNPTIPGDDIGGRLDPKESLGYIGSRLLYCPPIVGETTPTVQTGHAWWDWNSDPSGDNYYAEWYDVMSDGIWMNDPPSPHDFRFFQKTGPFEIAPGDSIRIVFAFGLGNGLPGMRSNLNNARLLFENDYVYYNLPPAVPSGFSAAVIDDDIELTWEPNSEPDLAGYNLYSSLYHDGPFQAVNDVPIDTTYYLYSPVDRDLFYFYLTALDNELNESMVTETLMVSLLPNPPSNLRAIPGDNSVTLTWDAEPDADGYKIYRGTEPGGPYSYIALIEAPNTGYVDNDVINYQTYYYVATSLMWSYESPYSGEVQVTPNPNSIDNGRVLLVDDYGERDYGGNLLEYQQRQRFYQRWGVYNFDYDIWSIADQGMVDSSTILNYQAVLFASDCEDGYTDGTWWYDVGGVNGGVLRHYMENGGHLMAVGQLIILDMTQAYPPDPQPGDFEYDWFGINSGDWSWDYWYDFTWAIGTEPGYPDSMKLDVAKVPDQEDYAISISLIRPNVDTLFVKGLDVYGDPPQDYMKPVAIIYRPDGDAVTSLINFSLYFMPAVGAYQTTTNILRDEFGCTFYEDPAPLPPWNILLSSLPENRLYLTWDAIDEDDVVSIKLYRSMFDGPFELIAALAPDVSEYLDEDITPGTEYNYYLTCVDFAGQESESSHIVTEYGGRPPAPENVQAESGNGYVSLSWEDPGDPDIVSFRIYRRHSMDNNFNHIVTLPSSNYEYIDYTVFNRNGYYYYLTSVTDYNIESYPSDTVFAFPHDPSNREGILVVNGVDWNTYGSNIFNFYQDEVPSGYNITYSFWDLFDFTPANIFSDSVTLIGNGEFPPELFNAFATIVWVGNSYSGDLEHWENNEDNIMEYLNTDGNLLLMCRQGDYFLFDELKEFAGITSVLTGYNPDYLSAQHDSLTDISRTGSLSYTDLVEIDTIYTEILYFAGETDPIAGLWTQGPAGTGNFIYLAGRPYRMNHDDLRQNCDVMLRYFFGIQTDIDDQENALPKEFALHQNYPNPFNPNTIIRFDLPVQSQVSLTIYNILGQQVKTALDRTMEAGFHEVIWDGKSNSGDNVSTGMYFYKLKAGDFVSVKKMLLLK